MAQRAKRPGAAKIRSTAFRRIRSDHQSELAQDYVELIADLIDETGEARGSDVALRLGVANATVVKTLRRLQDAGLVTQEPYRAIFLTGEGWKMAEDGRRKHKIVESFLLALGVSTDTARIDSEGIEHHVSDETLRAMARFLARGRLGLKPSS
ncbi:MAG: manganese-binding transcriptional regulator MntR [Aestuariivirga sp.]|uniref:manganese-binding transcriptional regulator MntR n=1 Tax=Aestuariivirga sp. TaxID=2650926 RepID=UPI0038D031B7